ncbi:Putative phage PhiRv1 protein [Mycobacterium canetti]|uniref:hypothetical protein n=1 Tax=Mycobacterium canetti TaxID=78331 RepID=UPI002D76F454|nr:hypothetical protein [Mycobacterium canetti]WRO41622.1 Putative phage PhiRv1 protein [Mycobacterium canetti]
MSRCHNIVIVCDHGRKGDGRIEHERCDLVAPIIWVDETQGWLPQAPAVATYLDPDNQPRSIVGLEPNNTRLQPGTRRDGWTRLHWEFACPRYSTGGVRIGVRTCEQRPVRVRNDDLQTLCEAVPRLLGGLADNPDYAPGIAVQTDAVIFTLQLWRTLCEGDTPSKLRATPTRGSC